MGYPYYVRRDYLHYSYTARLCQISLLQCNCCMISCLAPCSRQDHMRLQLVGCSWRSCSLHIPSLHYTYRYRPVHIHLNTVTDGDPVISTWKCRLNNNHKNNGLFMHLYMVFFLWASGGVYWMCELTISTAVIEAEYCGWGCRTWFFIDHIFTFLFQPFHCCLCPCLHSRKLYSK